MSPWKAIRVSVLVLMAAAAGADDLSWRQGFLDPPMDCRPHTRWWWMGNALDKDDISRQLREMHAQGIGGVEQITMDRVYEKGNVEYLSDAYFDLLRHAVSEAETLGMSVSLNFGGPGWIWGGDWVPLPHRNRTLLSSSFEVAGPAAVDRPLPLEATLNPRDVARSHRAIEPDDRLVAVVAAREISGVLDPASVRDITDRVDDRRLEWEVPEGSWRVMAFWSTIPEGGTAVNHVDRTAMAHYVERLGERYAAALGDRFGTVIESFFGDSFEVPVHRNGIYWSDALPTEFRARKGYDLVTHLPALWWELGAVSPKVRYDVNHVLHQMGMEAFFETFAAWCGAHGVRSRVQPYGFVTDNLEGAGAVDIPEMEITAGEKDAVPWFDTRIGPREYVASGAHLYGRNVVSTEAYTYMHWEPYRATLEELKIASDVFLRAGANKFYNHGFIASPERDIAPTRGFYAAIHISPDNVWWPYYRHLADYIARCSFLLRQGRPHADVAVYSPLANQWSRDALNARRWTRDFDWGDLGRLLLSNGYDFDLVNDDALQRLSSFDGQDLRVGEMRYRVILLPNVEAMPLASLERVAAYAAQGGVVMALERTPEASCGMRDHERQDRAVRDLASRLFPAREGRRTAEGHRYGEGTTYLLDTVMYRRDVLDRISSALDPFLKALRRHVTPAMGIDFVREDLRENGGLCFTRRTADDRDLYFVANIQDRPVDLWAAFRVEGAAPWRWDPYDGGIHEILEYREEGGVTHLPLRLAPYESTFVVFERSESRPHVTETSLASVDRVGAAEVSGWTDREGAHFARLDSGEVLRGRAEGVPAPLRLGGPWQLALESPTFPRYEVEIHGLVSWTELPGARHFSGTGVYTTAFEVPGAYLQEDVRLWIDLGDVGNVAEVRINGEAAGVAWMRGRRLDVTGKVRAGVNRLEVLVTNTLINRVAGLTAFPPVPEDLQARLGQGLHDDRSPAHTLLGFEPLPRSGLLGPVELHAWKRVSAGRIETDRPAMDGE